MRSQKEQEKQIVCGCGVLISICLWAFAQQSVSFHIVLSFIDITI